MAAIAGRFLTTFARFQVTSFSMAKQEAVASLSSHRTAVKGQSRRYAPFQNNNTVATKMRVSLKTTAFLWLAFWLCAGILTSLHLSEQIASNKNFIEENIKPSVDFIEKFKAKNDRLPNYREYYTWQRGYHKDYSSDLTQQVDSLIPGFGTIHYIRKRSDVVSDDRHKFKDADWHKDFAIGVWNGDWTEYYYSWTNTYDSNVTYQDGYIASAAMTVAGICPLLFWWLAIRRKSST